MALAIGLYSHASVALAETASDKTPLNLEKASGDKSASLTGSSGGGLMRTVIGLVIVVLVIWGISKVLRYVKASKDEKASGTGLSSLATLPLGNNRAVHVVRVGSDILLLGSAEQQVSQLARYTEEEARERGLLDMGGNGRSKAALLRNVVRTGATAQRETTPDGSTVHSASPMNAGSGLVDTLRAWTVRK
jgi:flagellar protein FliO/FliZ